MGWLSVTGAVQVIKEKEPPLLSSLDPRLRGDITTIVGKALEEIGKDPEVEATMFEIMETERLLEGVAVNLSKFTSQPDTEREVQALRVLFEGDQAGSPFYGNRKSPGVTSGLLMDVKG